MPIVLCAVFGIVLVSHGADFGLDAAVGQVPEVKKIGTDIPGILGGILGQMLSLVGIIFFALTIYGGVMWMLARGNPDMAKKALNTIISAIVGLILVLSSFALTRFVFQSIENTAPASVADISDGPQTESGPTGVCLIRGQMPSRRGCTDTNQCNFDEICFSQEGSGTTSSLGIGTGLCISPINRYGATPCSTDSDCTSDRVCYSL